MKDNSASSSIKKKLSQLNPMPRQVKEDLLRMAGLCQLVKSGRNWDEVSELFDSKIQKLPRLKETPAGLKIQI